MSKKGQDYFHLYLGCWVRIDEHGHFKLKAVDTANNMFGVLNGNPNGININWYKMSDTHKLILRPLSNMTEEEARKICEIINEPFVNYYVFGERISITLNTTINGDNRDRDLWIFYDGKLEIYSNDGKWGGVQNDNIWNMYELVIYLMKQGFDIFNLIPEKLAVDKTTI